MFKCSECGYLAVRARTSRELREAEGEYRKRGLRIAISEHIPICFAQVRDFREEIIKEKGASDLDSVDVIPFVSQEIDCNSFTKWIQGLTPKEHREMLDRQEWRDWQERQRKSDRYWRIVELIVLGFIAVVVAGGFTILGAFIERGSLFP